MPVRRCSHFFAMEIIVNHLESWNFFPFFGVSKQNTLSWTMLTFWMNWTSNAEHAGLTLRLTIQPPHLLCLLTMPLCSAHETIKIHAIPWRSRSCVSHTHHPMLHVSAGPIQVAHASPSLLATDASHHSNHSINIFFAGFFWERGFFLVETLKPCSPLPVLYLTLQDTGSNYKSWVFLFMLQTAREMRKLNDLSPPDNRTDELITYTYHTHMRTQPRTNLHLYVWIYWYSTSENKK